MLNNCLIVLPLHSEFKYFTDALSSFGFGFEESSIGKIPIKNFQGLGLICAIGGHGKVQFGIQTQFLLSSLPQISKIICIGAAGGLSKTSTFDIVVSNSTVEHDYIERFDPAPPPSFEGCSISIARLKEIGTKLDWNFKVHYGSIASGDEDVVTRERAYEIYEKTKALAVAWEGAGGARAASFNNLPYLEIRGITDIADNDAPIDFRENLKKSMENVALFVCSAIDR